MISTLRNWVCLAFFATIPIWADVPGDGSWAIFGALTLGLNAIAQYGYPAAYANLDSKAAWIRNFFLDLATCVAACDFFSAIKDWRWVFLYGTVVARWANPVLEANKDAVNRLVEVYRIKKNEPQRLMHGVLATPLVVTLITSLFWLEELRGYHVAIIWFHFVLSARYIIAAWAQLNFSDKEKESILRSQETVVERKKT